MEKINTEIYEKLNNEEKVILNVFSKLLNETGHLSRNVEIFPKEYIEDRLIVEKKDDKWVFYINERGKVSSYREYNDLFSLCMDLFEALDKESTDYCMKEFPLLVGESLNSQRNGKIR